MKRNELMAYLGGICFAGAFVGILLRNDLLRWVCFIGVAIFSSLIPRSR